MQITPVDDQHNLFQITNAVSQELAQLVLATDWLSLPWTKQPGQESWSRRLIDQESIPWIKHWHQEMKQLWPAIEQRSSLPILPYIKTAFWLDEPGFVCKMHTDGELPGSLHLNWQGPATCFYWHNDPTTIRYQAPAVANSGYLMINQLDDSGYRKLLWHDMPSPVAANTFRLTSYIWLITTT